MVTVIIRFGMTSRSGSVITRFARVGSAADSSKNTGATLHVSHLARFTQDAPIGYGRKDYIDVD